MARFKRREFGRAVGQQRSRGFMLSVGVAGLLLAAVTFYVGYEAAYSVPGRGYYNIKAQFDDANNLSNHYEVRIGGVRAGQVLNPRVENGHAVVDLRLDDKFKPLRSDSKLAVRLRSAVGVRFLEIKPGTKGTPLQDGQMLAAKQVTPSVALDDVLGTFDVKTRARTQTLLRNLGGAVDGRGTDVNETISRTPQLLKGLTGTANAITARPGEQFSGFIHNGAQVADAFDNARFDIIAGFKPQTQALKIFTDAKSDVQGTLDAAPPALGSLQQTLPHVNRLVNEVGRFSKQTRPTFVAAPTSLKAATVLLTDAEQPLDNLKDTLDLGRKAVDPTLGLLDQVNPVLPTIDKTITDVMPQATNLAPRACEIGNTLRSWGQYLGIGNTETNFIRFHLLAVRPEQPAGQISKGVPAVDDIYDKFVHSTPYYGPCTNGGSEGMTGQQAPTVAQILNAGVKPFNNSDNKPFTADPDKVSTPADVIERPLNVVKSYAGG